MGFEIRQYFLHQKAVSGGRNEAICRDLSHLGLPNPNHELRYVV